MRTLKKALCLVLCLVMVLGLCVFSVGAVDNFAGYTDANQLEEDYAEAVDVLIGLGIVEGMDATTLNLNGNYTRAQAAKITAYVALGPTAAANLTCSEAPFTDVGVDHWAAGYIAYCADHGILDGMGDGTFAPEATLTGYQFGKMMLCVVGYGQQGEYKDVGWEINVAKDGVRKYVYDNVLSAATNDVITRQQAMQMAFNTLTKVGVVKFSGLINDYVNARASQGQVITGETVDDNFLIDDNYPMYHQSYGHVSYSKANGWYIDGGYDVPVANINYKDYGKNAHIWCKYTPKGYEAITNYYIDDVELAESHAGNPYTLAAMVNSSSDYFKAKLDSTYKVFQDSKAYTYVITADTTTATRGTEVVFYDDNSFGLANGLADTVIIRQKGVAVLRTTPTMGKDGTTFTVSAFNPINESVSIWNGPQTTALFDGLDGLAAGDVVLYEMDAAGITHLKKAESKVDKLVRYTGANNNNIRLYSATADYRVSLLPTVALGTDNTMATKIVNELLGVDANFYFDDFGNIVYWNKIEAPTYNYAVLLDYGFTPGNGGQYTVSGQEEIQYKVYAKLLKTDGTVSNVVLKNVSMYNSSGDMENYTGIYGVSDDAKYIIAGKHDVNGTGKTYWNDDGESLDASNETRAFYVDAFYTYSVDSDGNYSLRLVNIEEDLQNIPQAQVTGEANVKNNVSKIVLGTNEPVYANYETVYLYKNTATDAYTATTNLRNAPTTGTTDDPEAKAAAAAVYDGNRTVQYIYLKSATGASVSDVYFVLGYSGIMVDDAATAGVNEKAIIYKAIKNGEIVDLFVACDEDNMSAAASIAAGKPAGFYNVKYANSSSRPSGYVAANGMDLFDGTGVFGTESNSVRYDRIGYVRSGSSAYTFTDDVKVYVADKSSGSWQLDTGDVKIITEDVNDSAWIVKASVMDADKLNAREIYIVRDESAPGFEKSSSGTPTVTPNEDTDDWLTNGVNNGILTVQYDWLDSTNHFHRGVGNSYVGGKVCTVTITHIDSGATWVRNYNF